MATAVPVSRPSGWTFQNLSATIAVVADQVDLNWQQLGKEVTRRRDKLGMTQREVEAADGPSVATLRLIESAQKKGYRSGVLAALERALQWPEGTIDAILTGTAAPTGPTLNGQQPDFDQLSRYLAGIAHNPNRDPALRAWAAAQLDQLTRIREADQLAAQERGEIAG